MRWLGGRRGESRGAREVSGRAASTGAGPLSPRPPHAPGDSDSPGFKFKASCRGYPARRYAAQGRDRFESQWTVTGTGRACLTLRSPP